MSDSPNIDVRLSKRRKAFLQRAARRSGSTTGPKNRYGLARFVLGAASRLAEQVLARKAPD